VKTEVFITDTHDPFRDERAHDLTLQILSDLQPDAITLGSDGLDCYKLSAYDKNPRRRETLQDEIDIWIANTKEIKQAAPNADLFWIPGNHEDRLRRLIWQNPGLYGLRALKWDNLLEFEQLGIKRCRRDERVIAGGRLVIKHGKTSRKHSTRSGWAELNNEAFSITTLTGHCHRIGVTYKMTRRGLVAAFECGCLCSLDPEYTVSPDWQQGITIVTYSEDEANPLFCVEPVVFIPSEDGQQTRVIWRGKEYVA
jgi:hypothetical protein